MRSPILLAILLLVSTADCQSNEDSQSADTEEKDSTSESNNSNETVEVEVIKPSDSTDRFSFTEADAKSRKQQLQNKEDNTLDVNGNSEAAAAAIDAELDVIETLLTDSEKFFGEYPEEISDSKVNDTAKNEENGNGPYGTVDPTIVPKAEEIQIRRSGDLNPDLVENNAPSVGFTQPRQDTSNPSLVDPNYIRTNVQSGASDSDNIPVLTQGGYQRPYQRRGRFNGQVQRVRSGSASQQSATVDTPLGRQNIVDQSEQPQIPPHVSYTNSYQPPFSYGAGPLLRQPFGYRGGFMNHNNPMSAAAPNSFFNAPTNGFDLMSPNFQSQFQQPGDSRFLNAPRDASGISFFQAPSGDMLSNNPDLLFQNPFRFSPIQQVNNDPSRPLNSLYSSGRFANYPGMDSIEDSPKPDYSAFFRNPSPMNPPFQTNPNFYATLPDPSANNFNNPTISLMPNYPTSGNGSPLSSRYVRYSTPDGQKMVQNNDQKVKKLQEAADTVDGETKEKDFGQIKESPNKEEPLLVPFGARIQRQEDPNQDFSGQRDVYIRYPMREAGYATEENLPVQNTTQRSMGNNDTPQGQPFPYFTLPRQFPGYSSPDPYRNALNAVQQGFSTTINSKSDDSNKTSETLPDEQIVPFPFDQNLPQPQNPSFTSYPDRNRDLTVLQSSPFYPAPGVGTIRNPFAPLTHDTLAVFPESNYPFRTSGSDGDTETPGKIPACAQKNNASMCFDDPEYPRREVLYALNSDSFLMERLVMPDQQLDAITLVEQNTSENPESTDNYICKSDIKTGMPLRAKNIEGKWKVIVNTERAIGRGVFKQPVRLEICRGASEPCSYTQIKTACVQKYSLQRLLSWNSVKGVHNDVFKIPVACSCQIVDKQE